MPQAVRPTFDKIATRKKMDAAKKSYVHLANRLGMTRQAVGHWFRGRGEPDMRQLKVMAEELGCHWLELVTEDTLVVFKEEERRRLERLRKASPEALRMIDRLLEPES